MATVDASTSFCATPLINTGLPLGRPMPIPVQRLGDIELILRAIIAISEELSCIPPTISDGEAAQQLKIVSRHLAEISGFAKEVQADEHH